MGKWEGEPLGGKGGKSAKGGAPVAREQESRRSGEQVTKNDEDSH